ncbi:MAG: DNA recombination protein RmuC [Bacteroidales bacterium]|nr:DNA recombination protein RmuC [Bacteroidales bacterium]
MEPTIIIVAVALVIIIAIVTAWIISSNKAKTAYLLDLQSKEDSISRISDLLSQREADLSGKGEEIDRLTQSLDSLNAQVNAFNVEIVRKESEVAKAEQLLNSEKERHEKMMAEVKSGFEKSLTELRASQERALESAKNELALENEKMLKAREESLKKEAAETMRVITGDLNKDIRDMKDAFDAQKKIHAEESSSIKTQFAETVRNLKEQTESIGSTAEDLAKALKGQSKVQGIFGETILENILKAEGLREGHDYDAEFWLRDRKGNRIVNEDTGKKMRPDFALHFPDNTVILIDSKVSLTALADYFAAETDEERAEASARNLESVENHIKELTSKEYQKYVVDRKTLEYVIMFIPNYAAYQLAKMEDKDIFAKAFRQNVLITTEETLIPFLRLIRSAWVQKEQMENVSEIVKAAQNMVDRVALFCEENSALEASLDTFVKKFKKNSARLVDSDQSIVKAAWKAVNHGIKQPEGHILPPASPSSISE